MKQKWALEERGHSTPCWIWQYAINAYGYGVAAVGNHRTRVAHRYLYEQLVGPIPEGHHLHHECGQRPCVNPSHLAPLTPVAHAQFSHESRKTHCVNGHEFTEENTYWRKDGRGKRCCRACKRQALRNFYARKRERG